MLEIEWRVNTALQSSEGEGLSDVWVLTKTITLSQDRVSKVWCSVLVSLLFFEQEIKITHTCTILRYSSFLIHTIPRIGLKGSFLVKTFQQVQT